MCEWTWWQCLSASLRSWTQELQHRASITPSSTSSQPWIEIQPNSLITSSAHAPTEPTFFFFFHIRAIEFSCGSGKNAFNWGHSLFPQFSLLLVSSPSFLFRCSDAVVSPLCWGSLKKTPCKQPAPWNTWKYFFCNVVNSTTYYNI